MVIIQIYQNKVYYIYILHIDLGDDGIILLEEYIRNKKIKLLKLTRNHISD